MDLRTVGSGYLRTFGSGFETESFLKSKIPSLQDITAGIIRHNPKLHVQFIREWALKRIPASCCDLVNKHNYLQANSSAIKKLSVSKPVSKVLNILN